MQRQLTTAIVLLVVAVIAGIWWFNSDPAAPPPTPSTINEPGSGAGPESVVAEGNIETADLNATVREAVAFSRGPLYDDPDIRAGLCGFKGRVVNHLKIPVPDCGVRVYRGAMDSVLQTSVDLFAEKTEFAPNYIAGEVQTAEDGTFAMTGVWPRGVYLMFAGIGTDAPTHQVITKVPSPGEIVDLGDVVLNDAGVIVGEVYNADGEPLAGALIRAADIPGALAAFFPAERFDPEGALLIREPRAPVHVLRMPPWVKHAFEHIPIPTTYSGPDGKFRLVGVMPGSNMLATTMRGYLSDVKPGVQVRPGKEKDVGRLRLREGEELYAKVLDQKGEPVVGAEVVAGSTLSMVPVDLASYLGVTNGKGEIDGFGFSPGKVTVAARRSKNHAWVLAEPQSIISDVIVTLPTQFGFTVHVQNADGTPVAEPRFRLLRGKKGDGAGELYLLGLSEPVSLKGRMTKLEDGGWHVTGLNKGPYTMLAEVEGLATGSEVIELEDKDETCVIKLEPPTLFNVMVVNQDGAPIRNAAIFAEPRGDRRVVEMPVNCGRTGKDGRLVINKVQADYLRVSADHPLYGVVHGEVKPGEELVLQLLAPGMLRGVLSENGKPPLPGKFTIAVMWRRNGGPRGPLENTPQLITAGLDGTFEATGLQPGNYRVMAMSSLDTLRSPGSIFDIAQSMYVNSNFPNNRVDIESGQTAEVRLEVGKKPIEGPTAQLSGTVMVNSRMASGYTIMGRGKGGRFGATVDERGRFDLGVVAAGDLRISIMGSEGGMFMGRSNSVWSGTVKLTEGEQRDMTIDISTGIIAGRVYLPDGSPAAKVFVRARGLLKGEGGERGSARQNEITKADGSFRFKDVAEGTWSLSFQADEGDDRWRGKAENLEVMAGGSTDSLRIDLKAARVVRGVVDLSVFEEKPRWGWIGFYSLKPSDGPGAKGSYRSGFGYKPGGKFISDEVDVGRYRIVLHTQGKASAEHECGIIDVPEAGLTGVKLVPQVR